MKKLSILMILIFLCAMSFAQKESGTVYSEHELINKTKTMWSSLIKGDKNAFVNYFSDSLVLYQNGKPSKILKESMGNFVNYWSNFENLEITNDHQSNPDAIDYGNMMFVQDWLKFSGIHKTTGINNDLSLHSLYGFDAKGKISVMYMYFDINFFEEIIDSQSTSENGELYINHPYINYVRKAVNAYESMDVEAWEDFFAPNARFYFSNMQFGETIDLATRKQDLKETFSGWEKLRMTQYGYPDCLHYAKGDSFVVYSWWILNAVEKDGKEIQAPLLLQHNFTKDGKILSESVYYSTNHLE